MQQQTTIFRGQNSGCFSFFFFYKFNVELNELTASFQKSQKDEKKIAKMKQCLESVDIRISPSKGYSTGNKSVKKSNTQFFHL